MTGTTGGTEDALSSAFSEKTYHDALDLVGDTVRYLEAQGNIVRMALDPHGHTAYAAESMRLTTRLMQVVAWFLVQRAVETGELTREQANDPARRLGAVQVCLGAAMEGAEDLPGEFLDLLGRSRNLFEQVYRIEDMLLKDNGAAHSPVHDLLDRLKH